MWYITTEQKPPTGVVVETKIDDENGVRNEGRLMFKHNLWFTPDERTYVYYRPTHWRYIN